jgi:hypothetical protein
MLVYWDNLWKLLKSFLKKKVWGSYKKKLKMQNPLLKKLRSKNSLKSFNLTRIRKY